MFSGRGSPPHMAGGLQLTFCFIANSVAPQPIVSRGRWMWGGELYWRAVPASRQPQPPAGHCATAGVVLRCHLLHNGLQP